MRTAIRITIALILLAGATPAARAQQKPAITPADYGKWESLGFGATLSPDGRWLAYPVSRVNEQNELRFRALAGDTTHAALFGTGAAFSNDSRWLAWLVGVSPEERERLTQQKKPVHNRLVLRDLRGGDTLVVERVAAFAFSPDGRSVAMRGYPAEGVTSGAADLLVRDLGAGSTTSFGNVTAFAWSGATPLLAFTVATSSGSGNGLHLYGARTGTIRVLDSSTSLYRGLAWRTRADDLAVLRTSTDTAFTDTAHAVLAWRSLAARAPTQFTLDPASNAAVPAGMRIAQDREPEWSRDGKQIRLGLRPRERKPAPTPAPAPAPSNAPSPLPLPPSCPTSRSGTRTTGAPCRCRRRRSGAT